MQSVLAAHAAHAAGLEHTLELHGCRCWPRAAPRRSVVVCVVRLHRSLQCRAPDLIQEAIMPMRTCGGVIRLRYYGSLIMVPGINSNSNTNWHILDGHREPSFDLRFMVEIRRSVARKWNATRQEAGCWGDAESAQHLSCINQTYDLASCREGYRDWFDCLSRI